MLIMHILRDKGEKVHTVPGEATLEEAARSLHQLKVGAVVVLDAAGALAGVLSERDIIREVALGGPKALSGPVSRTMTRAIFTATPDESLEEGLARMTDRRVRHLPVVSGGRLVGIVSIGDLVKRRIEDAEAQAKALTDYISAN